MTLQFEPRPTAGRPPGNRGYHAAVLADSRLYIFGGFDGHSVFDDVCLLDLAAAAYLPQVRFSYFYPSHLFQLSPLFSLCRAITFLEAIYLFCIWDSDLTNPFSATF